MQQTSSQVETFTGVVENAIPQRDIGWVRTDAGETLFFHRNYVRNHKLPEIGQRVKGRIGRVANEDQQARAFAVEVCA
jgi:hypothetical protein